MGHITRLFPKTEQFYWMNETVQGGDDKASDGDNSKSKKQRRCRSLFVINNYKHERVATSLRLAPPVAVSSTRLRAEKVRYL